MQPYSQQLCCGEYFIKESTNDKQFPPLCSDIYSIQPWTTDLELQQMKINASKSGDNTVIKH